MSCRFEAWVSQGGCRTFCRPTSSMRTSGWTSGRFPTHTMRRSRTTGCGCGCWGASRISGRGCLSGCRILNSRPRITTGLGRIGQFLTQIWLLITIKLSRYCGWRGWPQLPDGVFLEDNSPDSECVKKFNASCGKLGVPVTKMRRATGKGPLASSLNLLLPEAMATGNLTLVPDAVAREISLDKATGLANGVHFVNRVSKREMFAQARVVMVGASCLESTRLLLNSGLGGASGALGHYLHDQFYISQGVMASMPEARDGKSARGMVGGGGYIPRFRNLVKEKPDRPDFIRGYAMDFSTGGTPDAKYFPSYGAVWVKRWRGMRTT